MFASIHSLKICAAMMLACAFAFAASSAQAQTECPTDRPLTNGDACVANCPDGRENVRGICRDVCAEGEIRLTSQRPGAEWNTGCFPASVGPILDACEDAGWAGREDAGAFFGLGEVICRIPSELLISTGTAASSGSQCYMHGDTSPACQSMYGDPPVFPKATDHPNVNRFDINGNAIGDHFVANCDRDGSVPGGYPPNHNIGGAIECSCNLDSHIGEYPDCVAAPTLTRAQREAVSACVSQGWTISTTTAPIQCEIPLTSGGTDYPGGCFFSGGEPLCAEVFGEEHDFPVRMLSGLAGNLFNGFKAIADLSGNPLYIKTAAGVYRDAVLARYEGDSDYLAGPLANIEANSDGDNSTIVITVSGKVFTDNEIPFDYSGSGTNQAARLAALPGLITAAFAMIPVRQPYVFNCGEGMSPAGANLNGATECVRQTNLRLRLRLFLEGPLR